MISGKGKHIEELNNFKSRRASFLKTDAPNVTSDIQEIFIEEPKLCTHCNKTGNQIFIEIACVTGKNKKFDAVGLYGCHFCKETTISYFNIEDVWFRDKDDNSIHQLKFYTVAEQLPKNNFNVELPEVIQNKYKNFTEVFTQSKTAEENDLHQLAGMGYRKSIEFLVTDFLKDYPTNDKVTAEWLENHQTTLKMKIDKLPNRRLKKTANAIAFIGNEETHYTVRNPDYNIHDMKKFIALLIKEIESELIYDEVENFLG